MNRFSTQLLLRMDDAGRAKTGRLLLDAGKRRTTDPRAVQGLAELKSKAAVPLIKKTAPAAG